VERSNEVELALGLVLDRLSPAERAAFLLREAFDYSCEEIAMVLQTQVNVRQQVRRARIHLEGAGQTTVTGTSQQGLSEAFMTAARNGDMTRVEELLIADVSGSKGRACRKSGVLPLEPINT
jgi:RNA polymerase sigma-70 factor, ECF subfamily